MKPFTKFLFLFLLFSVQGLFSLETTKVEAEGYLRSEYTRSNDFLCEVSAIGTIELDNMYVLKSGLGVGRTLIDTNLNFFLNAGVSPFTLPLSFSASYYYNGLPEYETHTHSFLPLISYHGDRAGISLGCNFRFTYFFGEEAQYESVLSFNVFYNFINNDTLLLGINIGNFDDFYAKNMGAYSLNILGVIKLNDNWGIINNIEYQQSGGDGLTTTLYGVAWKTGVKYTW